jgi:hypothetical protein
MFTKPDLFALIDAAPPLGVSLFLPTHVRSAEVREGPIRLKNLAAEARNQLLATGMKGADADELLAPARGRIEDYGFWQHQDEGLALFLGAGEAREHRVPMSFEERVVVGPGFHVKPLLPLLAADGAFHVLTITADRVRLFDASRFAMSETELDDAPKSLDEVKGGPGSGDPDYENPVQAAPVARPHTAAVNIGNAQVYGDSPEDWRKGRLVEYVRRVASALEGRLASDAVPVVLVADAETGGHFRKVSSLGALLAGVVETNPAAMDKAALLEAAYAVVAPQFDAGRREAVERLAALHGSGDTRAAISVEDVVRAAHQGRVDVLLLVEGASVAGSYDAEADEVKVADEDAGPVGGLLDTAAVQALRHGGSVHVVSAAALPDKAKVSAVLRY